MSPDQSTYISGWRGALTKNQHLLLLVATYKAGASLTVKTRTLTGLIFQAHLLTVISKCLSREKQRWNKFIFVICSSCTECCFSSQQGHHHEFPPGPGSVKMGTNAVMSLEAMQMMKADARYISKLTACFLQLNIWNRLSAEILPQVYSED